MRKHVKKILHQCHGTLLLWFARGQSLDKMNEQKLWRERPNTGLTEEAFENPITKQNLAQRLKKKKSFLIVFCYICCN